MLDACVDPDEWAKEVEDRGAGEIMLTSMDRDGTKAGYDLEMLEAVADAVNIPVIASGGAGNKAHFYEALTVGKASAALAASLFHFNELRRIFRKIYCNPCFWYNFPDFFREIFEEIIGPSEYIELVNNYIFYLQIAWMCNSQDVFVFS